MNQFWKEVRLAAIMGLVVPGIILGTAVAVLNHSDHEMENMEILSTQPSEESTSIMTVSVQMDDGSVKEMQLSDYLTGVVLAEMPASFEMEALKAQTVVARTYVIRAEEKGGKHDSAAVCTDSGCCQGYLMEDNYLFRGESLESVEKIKDAVMQTEHEVLTYDGELIEATYFSCSGGSTEDAAAVWGTDVPYLQAMPSPGEEDAAYFTDMVSFKPKNFAAALGLDLQGEPSAWFGKVTYTDGGGVDTMVIGGIAFKGTTLRSALGLRSTAFTVSADDDAITIRTKGYGHRVGMSQYGADAMAVSGSTYDEILAYYYQGTTLVNWID